MRSTPLRWFSEAQALLPLRPQRGDVGYRVRPMVDLVGVRLWRGRRRPGFDRV